MWRGSNRIMLKEVNGDHREDQVPLERRIGPS
jgi:hypothetical protein